MMSQEGGKGKKRKESHQEKPYSGNIPGRITNQQSSARKKKRPRTNTSSKKNDASAHVSESLSRSFVTSSIEEEAAEKIDMLRKVPTVPLVARPRSRSVKSKASAVAKFVLDDLQKFIKKNTRLRPFDTEADTQTSAGAGTSSGADSSFSAGLEPLHIGDRSNSESGVSDDSAEHGAEDVADIYTPLLRLTKPRPDSGMRVPMFIRESEMYPCIKALFRYVDDAIDRSPSAGSTRRRLKVCCESDTTPSGADDYNRIDIGLSSRLKTPDDDASGELGKPDYGDMLAVIEAKRSIAEQTTAYRQMYMYTRNIYPEQAGRRFVWGLTFCDSVAHACILGHDNVFSSDAMDLSTSEGRSAFVALAVDMSFCESDQLGYDPNIYHNATRKRWEMSIYDDALKKQQTYHVLGCVQAADRVYGRHTRCFICRKVGSDSESGPEAAPEESAASNATSHGKRDILVKDAWPHAEIADGNRNQRARDEIEMMRTIDEKLGNDPDFQDKYPKVVAAGVVRQFCGSKRTPIEDTTENMFAKLGKDIIKDIPHRVHKRIAMEPVGLSIRKVRSVDELIVVAADVMKAHQEILRRCDILHRDLSLYNMLMTRDSDGMAHGMLIDFDCAVWASEESARPRANMTGTLPYMSIANLDELAIKRTSLDDWESLIYILCWLGTFGINDQDEKSVDTNKYLPIKAWAEGNAESSASSKRDQMTSAAFSSSIVSEFLDIEGYSALSILVLRLRSKLFDNPKVSSIARGTRRQKAVQLDLMANNQTVEQETKGYLDGRLDKSILDPFARRAEFEKEISDDLWNVMADAQQQALERIRQQRLQ
ncbi:hypothetical protein H4R99_005545 [Coemansia sp. RSA 1722]|nr:hypothetical protein H4R99_005545 [Coemansia sp. RSA 1722]